MTINEMIKKLEWMLHLYGNVRVYANDSNGDPAYISNINYESSHRFNRADGSSTYVEGIFIE